MVFKNKLFMVMRNYKITIDTNGVTVVNRVTRGLLHQGFEYYLRHLIFDSILCLVLIRGVNLSIIVDSALINYLIF